MSDSLTSSEKNQKTQNILQAGTLWEVKESAKALKNMEKINAENSKQIQHTNDSLNEIKAQMKLGIEQQKLIAEEGNKIATESLMIQKSEVLKNDENRIKQELKEIDKENLEQLSKHRKDAFFHLKQELDDLEKSTVSNLEKYFSLESIKVMLKKYKFSTNLTDDLIEKQLVHDSLTKVKELDKVVKNFNKQEKLDFNAIAMIMEHDEENEVLKLKKERENLIGESKERINVLKKSNDFKYVLKNYSSIIKKLKQNF